MTPIESRLFGGLAAFVQPNTAALLVVVEQSNPFFLSPVRLAWCKGQEQHPKRQRKTIF
jgi:hypothetical protein